MLEDQRKEDITTRSRISFPVCKIRDLSHAHTNPTCRFFRTMGTSRTLQLGSLKPSLNLASFSSIRFSSACSAAAWAMDINGNLNSLTRSTSLASQGYCRDIRTGGGSGDTRFNNEKEKTLCKLGQVSCLG